jgi:biopolymer transport protein TolR
MTGSTRRTAAKRGDLPINAEINVTSLIDVAFTLLVIFIITAPALTGGLEVNLPETRTQPLTVSDQSFIVSMDASGEIYIGETPVSREEFVPTLGRLMDVAGARDVFLKADEAQIHGPVVWVIGHMQAAAVERGGRFALIAEAEMRR